MNLLKCTIEVSKPATLLDGLEPLRADLAQLESWLRPLPPPQQIQHRDSFLKMLHQAALKVAECSDQQDERLEWLWEMLLDACLLSTSPHRLPQILRKLAERLSGRPSLRLYQSAINFVAGLHAQQPGIIVALVRAGVGEGHYRGLCCRAVPAASRSLPHRGPDCPPGERFV
ncbi:hypothetical protein WJX84_006992 [Apatococcus fuscideae]|uniref:Fanconi Anaemia group E protein C-terminal domain-containing protein n=1 Tax=Apatococcus fuscideae TaxID=2026836 RepID=A0AAW1T0K8_9CHLO